MTLTGQIVVLDRELDRAAISIYSKAGFDWHLTCRAQDVPKEVSLADWVDFTLYMNYPHTIRKVEQKLKKVILLNFETKAFRRWPEAALEVPDETNT